MAAEDTSLKVSFTVKELLTQINGKLDVMAIAIAAKAEAAEVVRLAAKVEAMDATNRANEALGKVYLAEWDTMKVEVKRLRENAISDKTLKTYKRWLIVTGIAALGSVATALGLAIRFIH